MSFPGVIERPLLSDEFSLYLDNRKPVPLAVLATLLGKIDREARAVAGMDGLFLELSAFATGSNELRFRIVGPGRLSLQDAEHEESEWREREVAAAETSARWSCITGGATIVSAVVAAVAVAISSGNANPAASRITTIYEIDTIYIRAPGEPPYVVTKGNIEHGRDVRRANRKRPRSRKDAEERALFTAMEDHAIVDLAGWFDHRPGQALWFRTMHGNRFPARFQHAGHFGNAPIAIRAIVHDSPDGLSLEVVDVITPLSTY